MKIFYMFIIVMLLCSPAFCEQKYNAMTGEWETVPSNSDYQLKYNTFENDWSYQPKESKVEYNAFENKWEWDSGKNK